MDGAASRVIIPVITPITQVRDKTMLKADISFDILNINDDQNVIEGCYRLEGESWRVFYFSKMWSGRAGEQHERKRGSLRTRSSQAVFSGSL